MAAGSVYPDQGMSKRGHRKFGLFAHITWHTWRRERSVRRSEVDVVGRGILSAAERQSVHVLAQAVLADHTLRSRCKIRIGAAREHASEGTLPLGPWLLRGLAIP